MTFRQLRLTSEAWLRHRGYMPTSLGWWQPEDLEEMGAMQTASGEWAIAAEERRRVMGKGGEQKIQVYHVATRANAFFARRRAANARIAGLLAASSVQSSESGADLVAYARQLFSSGKMLPLSSLKKQIDL
jgi:hypothetical protein